ncbi:hypothetical protein B0G76_8346 [Paraburkholderia sp. BL23I1N1]|nr:hypothetical protein B0G76_8346 [Paraburkholderia sp. BL23I1N1]
MERHSDVHKNADRTCEPGRISEANGYSPCHRDNRQREGVEEMARLPPATTEDGYPTSTLTA